MTGENKFQETNRKKQIPRNKSQEPKNKVKSEGEKNRKRNDKKHSVKPNNPINLLNTSNILTPNLHCPHGAFPAFY